MNSSATSPTTQSTLLLCAQFKQTENLVAPLTTGEYHKLARLLREHDHAVADLVEPTRIETALDVLREAAWDSERVERLLARGAAVAIALDRWQQAGIWALGAGDTDYPARWTHRLGTQAPPLIYGIGDARLAAKFGYAIVGSRDADEHALELTVSLARTCVEQEIVVISGGAKGVDNAAMTSAIESGGKSVGILADGLARAGVAVNNRDALERKSLLLLSPYSPDAPFNVGAAMGRNKLIYALAATAFVISSDAQTGGTWSGATENLKAKWSPLFVRTGASAPPGNELLMGRGATAFPESALTRELDLRDWCEKQSVSIGDDSQTSLGL